MYIPWGRRWEFVCGGDDLWGAVHTAFCESAVLSRRKKKDASHPSRTTRHDQIFGLMTTATTTTTTLGLFFYRTVYFFSGTVIPVSKLSVFFYYHFGSYYYQLPSPPTSYFTGAKMYVCDDGIQFTATNLTTFIWCAIWRRRVSWDTYLVTLSTTFF